MVKKRKLLVVLQGNVGGAERIAVTVTKGLTPERYEVVYCLVGMSTDNQYPIEEFIPTVWNVIHIKRMHSARLIFELLRVIIKEKPDTVFSSTLYINDKLLLFRRIFPYIKYIIRCENYLYTFKNKQLQIIKKTYKNANLIIAQTEEMKAELIEQMGIPDEKITVLHNPVDKETIEKKLIDATDPYKHDDKTVFCACGKFSKQKGFDLLIDAFAIVKKRVCNARLCIVGENGGRHEEYYLKLREKAESLGILDSIIFTGYQNNPYPYIKYADCFVLSSRWEGLPNVMIEALYLGTPVAAFKCIPIIQRIINDGVDGYLADNENVNSLADSMVKASKLGRIETTYKSSSIDDFCYIFENGRKPIMKIVIERGGKYIVI